jgi:hypothetical protein
MTALNASTAKLATVSGYLDISRGSVIISDGYSGKYVVFCHRHIGWLVPTLGNLQLHSPLYPKGVVLN